MPPHLYTADEIAARLNLHVKTVRRYIREGRLKAKRIGKEYRVAAPDLDEFAGTTGQPERRSTARQVIASTIIDIDNISQEDSDRITTLIMAALNTRRGEPEVPRADGIYFRDRARLRISITANPAVTSELLRTIDALARGTE
jgi:excisionase family DNA binding protein